jgi:hypothetical protein
MTLNASFAPNGGLIDPLRFKNVVVVRFSVRSRRFERKFLSSERARSRWFQFRAQLFEATLGPSLSAQSIRPAAVFLYFDSADVNLVEAHFKRVDFIPVFATDAHEQAMGEKVLALGMSEHVVLSRIDSDDIVERNYLLKINNLLNERYQRSNLGDEALISSRSGFRTNFSKVQRVLHLTPPFLSRYFRQYVGQGAYFDHTKTNQSVGTRIADYSAEWLQVIHGTNVANKFKPESCDWTGSHEGITSSQFGPTKDFDAHWFSEWAGIDPVSPECFSSKSLPLVGVKARLRLTIRRWLRQA